MKRHFTRLSVAIIAILLAKLIYAYAHEYFHHYTDGRYPYKSTAIQMAAIVLIFYPVFHFLDKYFKYTSKKYMEGARRLTKGRFLGLFLGFAFAIFLLFMAFVNVWFHRNLIHDLQSWLKGLF